MNNAIIYTKHHCAYCEWAKKLLTTHHIPYTEINVQTAKDTDQALEEMLKKGKGKTFPQIILDGEPIGGYDDLSRLLADK